MTIDQLKKEQNKLIDRTEKYLEKSELTAFAQLLLKVLEQGAKLAVKYMERQLKK